MNTQFKQIESRDEIPENYRNPGNISQVAQLGPSTRELLSLLSNLETKIAA